MWKYPKYPINYMFEIWSMYGRNTVWSEHNILGVTIVYKSGYISRFIISLNFWNWITLLQWVCEEIVSRIYGRSVILNLFSNIISSTCLFRDAIIQFAKCQVINKAGSFNNNVLLSLLIFHLFVLLVEMLKSTENFVAFGTIVSPHRYQIKGSF